MWNSRLNKIWKQMCKQNKCETNVRITYRCNQKGRLTTLALASWSTVKSSQVFEAAQSPRTRWNCQRTNASLSFSSSFCCRYCRPLPLPLNLNCLLLCPPLRRRPSRVANDVGLMDHDLPCTEQSRWRNWRYRQTTYRQSMPTPWVDIAYILWHRKNGSTRTHTTCMM